MNKILTPINGKTSKSLNINSRLNVLTDDLKEDFIKNFEIVFAPEFQEQFENVISKVSVLIGKSVSNYEAVLYYSWISNYIFRKVTEVTGGTSLTKTEIIALIRDGKKIVFDSSYHDYLGHESYIKYVGKRFIKPIKKRNNFIFLGDIEVDMSVTLYQMLQGIIDHYYLKATYDIQPLNIIADDDIISELKIELIRAGEKFNDGYEFIEFNSGIYSENPIINKQVRGVLKRATNSLERTSFKIRIISSSTYQDSAENLIDKNMTYILGNSRVVKYQEPYQFIEKLNTKELLTLFKK